MDVLETNLVGIATTIFSKPPGPPCSIELQLEEDSVPTDSTQLSKTITDILLFLTINGVELLFGHRNLQLLSFNDFRLLTEYVNSYGYNPIVTANNTSQSPWELLNLNTPVHTINISFTVFRK